VVLIGGIVFEVFRRRRGEERHVAPGPREPASHAPPRPRDGHS
jgi:hypothetical protein